MVRWADLICGKRSRHPPSPSLRIQPSFRGDAIAPDLRCAIAHRGISPLSFRDGALAPDPESRDSGFDATHRPGMTDGCANDGWPHLRIPAAYFARVGTNRSAPGRAWGMPGAQCTRSLVCESGGWNAHEYSQRVHRKTPGIPTQWFTTYRALSSATGLSCHRRLRKLPQA
jgi:hypothetical protein